MWGTPVRKGTWDRVSWRQVGSGSTKRLRTVSGGGEKTTGNIVESRVGGSEVVNLAKVGVGKYSGPLGYVEGRGRKFESLRGARFPGIG